MTLIEVELGEVKKAEKEIAGLLRQRLKTDVATKGGKLLLNQTNGPDVSPKDAKLQVKYASERRNQPSVFTLDPLRGR
jgi:hypothetical protein